MCYERSASIVKKDLTNERPHRNRRGLLLYIRGGKSGPIVIEEALKDIRSGDSVASLFFFGG